MPPEAGALPYRGPLVSAAGRRTITPDRELGRGGEATVFGLTGNPALAVKLYHRPTAEHGAKLAAMRATVPRAAEDTAGHFPLAWPQDLVLDATGRTVGFLMPRLDSRRVRPLHQLYHPGSRRQTAPGISWRYLLRTARNLSTSLAALHEAGYVVGDLNESNILVDERALVTLIDLDSIQVRAGRTIHRCTVGKAEYTPPELQGRSFRTTNRRPASDTFALAVLTFQLLMEGLHPFAGVYQGSGDPPGLVANIRARRSPWFGNRMLQPPPTAPPLQLLDRRIRQLLIRSLVSPAFARPAARDWQLALDRLETKLRTCSVNPLHDYGAHLRHCPWCRRKEQLGLEPFPALPKAGGLL
jgi:DNA-binding helix-hairpin-helix protein with protein kinase domain